jgi:hypothetical protein
VFLARSVNLVFTKIDISKTYDKVDRGFIAGYV